MNLLSGNLSRTVLIGFFLVVHPAIQLADASFCEAVVETVRSEHTIYQGLDECQSNAMSDRIGEYWQALGQNLDGCDTGSPWSAAFISFMVRKACGGNRFRYSIAHRDYISDAFGGGSGLYNSALDATTADIKPGDLVCSGRGSSAGWTFQDFQNWHNAEPRPTIPTHCDIVVAVAGNILTTIGGNLGDTVRQNVVPKTSYAVVLKVDEDAECDCDVCTNRPLLRSQSGFSEEVKGLQTLLNTKHAFSLTVDGIFGPATEAAGTYLQFCFENLLDLFISLIVFFLVLKVMEFQTRNMLTADGIVGEKTWEKLCANGDSTGDPHFTTWRGYKYDFQGACDLVLVHNPKFANGLGMDIHIRTKLQGHQGSFIESIVVKLGTDVLEVKANNTKNGKTMWLNGVENPEDLNHGSLLAGFPVKHKTEKRRSTMSQVFKVAISDVDYITIKTYKHLLNVHFTNSAPKFFSGSVGLLGDFDSGQRVGRDNKVWQDQRSFDMPFGNEWQVLESEPMLFHNREGPQHPERCLFAVAPVTGHLRSSSSRRLDEAFPRQIAEEACSNVKKAKRADCVFDVIAFNDVDMVALYEED